MKKTQNVIFLAFCLVISNSEGKYGGNDIFTSIEAMKRLWIEEKLFVGKLEQTINNFEVILNGMKRYSSIPNSDGLITMSISSSKCLFCHPFTTYE
jgi:hypothetical protein